MSTPPCTQAIQRTEVSNRNDNHWILILLRENPTAVTPFEAEVVTLPPAGAAPPEKKAR
jgi:hypothetical protein